MIVGVDMDAMGYLEWGISSLGDNGYGDVEPVDAILHSLGTIQAVMVFTTIGGSVVIGALAGFIVAHPRKVYQGLRADCKSY